MTPWPEWVFEESTEPVAWSPYDRERHAVITGLVFVVPIPPGKPVGSFRFLEGAVVVELDDE